MEFGLFSNGERTNKVAADSYDEDLWEIMLADRLGFREVWVSEHVGHTHERRLDKVSVADLFIAKAAGLTKQIRFGPGIRPMTIYHPLQVATDAAMCDHLTRGRYIAGFGLGGGSAVVSQWQQRGFPDTEPEVTGRARMHEAIDFVLRCWTEPEPFDYEGAFWWGKGINLIPKPYTKPHPSVGVAVSKTMGTVELAAQRGFMPVFSQYDEASHLREMGDTFAEAASKAGRAAQRSAIRACRVVWVGDTDQEARDQLRPTASRVLEFDKAEYPAHYRRYMPPSGRIEDVTYDHLVEAGFYVVGSPDTVYQRIVDLYDRSGGFGTLLVVVGKRYGTQRQRARSMRRFMTEVAPRLEAVDADHGAPLQSPT